MDKPSGSISTADASRGFDRRSDTSDTSTASLQSHIHEILDSARSGMVAESSELNSLKGNPMLHNNDSSVTKQQILLTGSDHRNSFPVYGQEVTVIASQQSEADNHSSGSNKVKVKPVVNHEWEHRYYFGHLVAVHRSGQFVAFVVKGKDDFLVRVYNRLSAERCLLKGYRGKVVDIAFARLHAVLLGSVDEVGNLLVYDIQTGSDSKLTPHLVLHITRGENPSIGHHRLIWCPYIPEDADTSGTTSATSDSIGGSEDLGKLLVLTHESTAEMWHVETVCRDYGSGPLQCSEVDNGSFVIPGQTADSHNKAIVDAAFSPDGTALATASLDGDVRFFQVNLQEKSPRCLHKWTPHDGRPVTRLFFLDDHKHANPEYAVTGANYNQEIKIWACETWTCLQTIHLLPTSDIIGNNVAMPCLQIEVDLGARYIVMSDIRRKVIYVMQLFQDIQASHVHVSSFSEFLLAQSYVSLAIQDASRRKLIRNGDEGDIDDINHDEDDKEEAISEKFSAGQESTSRIVIKLSAMHSKALQDLVIDFKAEQIVAHPASQSVSSCSQDDMDGVPDMLSDISMEASVAEVLATTNGHSSAEKEPVVLLTPDVFLSSPGTRPSITDAVRSSGSSLSSFTQVTDEENARVTAALPSPGSSVTVTPSSSRDFYNHTSPSHPLLAPGDLKVQSPGSATFPPSSSRNANDFQTSSLVLKAPLTAADFLPSPESRSVNPISLPHTSIQSNVVNTRSGRRSSLESLEVKHILENGESLERSSNTQPVYNWPQAPDVSGEAKRLAADVIDQVTRPTASDESERDDEMHEYDEDDEDVSDREGIASHSEQLWKGQQEKFKKALIEDVKTTCKESITDVHASINNLSESVQLLQAHIGRLGDQKSEVKEEFLRKQMDDLSRRQTTDMQTVRSQFEALSNSILRQQQADMQRLQKLLNDSETRETQRLERLTMAITQSVERTVSTKLEKMVRDQIRDVVVPGVSQVLEPLKEQLHFEIAKKLTATDELMKDNIGKLVRSKQTMELLGETASDAMAGCLTAACRDLLIPAFDRSCQVLFNQVNQSFHAGTVEYEKQLTAHLEQLRLEQNRQLEQTNQKLNPLVNSLKQREDLMEGTLNRLQVMTENINHQAGQRHSQYESMLSSVNTAIQSMQDHLPVQIRSIVKEELQTALNDHKVNVMAAMRSQASTPVPDAQQLQAVIMGLLRQGQVNSAFQQALSASDLSIVMWLCETVNHSQVFTSPCPLQQPVLLSLIQQLSTDINSQTDSKKLETKIRYLTEAVGNINNQDPVSQDHLPPILNHLIVKLQQFVEKNPGHKSVKEIKFLILAAKGLQQ